MDMLSHLSSFKGYDVFMDEITRIISENIPGIRLELSQPYRQRRRRQNVMYIYAFGIRHWALKFFANCAEIIIRPEIL
jgi:hypothetical protein